MAIDNYAELQRFTELTETLNLLNAALGAVENQKISDEMDADTTNDWHLVRDLLETGNPNGRPYDPYILAMKFLVESRDWKIKKLHEYRLVILGEIYDLIPDFEDENYSELEVFAETPIEKTTSSNEEDIGEEIPF